MTLTPTQKRRIRAVIYGDKVVFKKDGTVEVLHSYFYTMGQTTSSFEKGIKADLAKHGIKIQPLKTWDHFSQFRGGASIRAGSHFGLLFKVVE